MAKLFGDSGKKFDATKGKTMDEFDVIPTDWYPMEIVDSDYKENKDETGHYASFKFKILEGKHKDRFVFTNLNLDHPNEATVEIAEKEFRTLCRACGKPAVEDTEELHGIPFMGHVGPKKASKGYPPGNKMLNYKPMEGAGKPANPSKSSGDEPKAAAKAGKKKPDLSFD